MSERILRGVAVLALACAVLVPAAFGEGQPERKATTKVPAIYPELAKSMRLTGTVRLEVTITPAGSVKSTKVIGGHPMLVESALAVINKWKFEPAKEETTQVVAFNFHP